MTLDAHVIAGIEPLLAALARERRVIGPVEREGAILYREIAGAEDLPRGRIDEQAPGRYRLGPGDPARWFDYVVGPESWKGWLFPPRRKLFTARRAGGAVEIAPEAEPWPETVFLGVRPCEIAAIETLDRVFAEGPFADPDYVRRRDATLIVALQCARAAETCFCASMGTGPRAEAGFDLALTELEGRFLLEIGSEAGRAALAGLDLVPADAAALAEARAATVRAARQSRAMPDAARGIAEAPEHAGWDDVAARCLACANCTLACPTCFCSDVEDVADLEGATAERWQLWDSCFGLDFSHLAGGGPVRRTIRARYRQWLTHKLSHWHAQFGRSGCVGCGRCIAWCPVGIDITEEAARIAAPAP